MKTLVNIIDTTNPLPAYLFVKEHYTPGDHLLFISAFGDEWMATHLTKMLGTDPALVTTIAMTDEAENHKYEHICRRILPHLSHDTHYEVNLAGGTRYMCLAVEKVFETFPAKSFYVKTRENEIVSTNFDNSLYDEDDITTPIHYHMTLAEYLSLHNLSHDISQRHHTPIRDPQTVHRFFRTFAYDYLNNDDFTTINLLRRYYRDMEGPLDIARLEKKGIGRGNPPLPRLYRMMNHVDFLPQDPSVLTHDEADYLTGGWFEEYVYYLVNSAIHPDDIATGIHIARTDSTTDHDNELDVLFIKNNRLFVIECKSGITSEHLFNEIVYKSCALREALLGMTTFSYIFALKNDRDNHLRKIAGLMDITFCDKDCLTGEGILSIFNQMKNLCK
jgi:hypothetical protein